MDYDFSKISTKGLKYACKKYEGGERAYACRFISCSDCPFDNPSRDCGEGRVYHEFKKELNRRFKAETPKVMVIKDGPDFSNISTNQLKKWEKVPSHTCPLSEGFHDDKCNVHDCVFKAVDPSKACGGFCDQQHELIEAEIKRREDCEKGVERMYSDPIGIPQPQGMMVSSPFPTKESFSMTNCVVNQSTPNIIAVDYEEEEEVELAKW